MVFHLHISQLFLNKRASGQTDLMSSWLPVMTDSHTGPTPSSHLHSLYVRPRREAQLPAAGFLLGQARVVGTSNLNDHGCSARSP